MKQRQAKSTAVTGWVTLDLSPPLKQRTCGMGGKLGGILHCPVGADIPERDKVRIKIHLSGWHAVGAFVTLSLRNKPGSRAIAAVEYSSVRHLKKPPLRPTVRDSFRFPETDRTIAGRYAAQFFCVMFELGFFCILL